MKRPVFIFGLLLVALMLALAGQWALHSPAYPVGASSGHPLRVLRTPHVAHQPRHVGMVN